MHADNLNVLATASLYLTGTRYRAAATTHNANHSAGHLLVTGGSSPPVALPYWKSQRRCAEHAARTRLCPATPMLTYHPGSRRTAPA